MVIVVRAPGRQRRAGGRPRLLLAGVVGTPPTGWSVSLAAARARRRLFMLPHWPVFNVADICIDVAAAWILLQVFRGVRPTAAERCRTGAGVTAAVEHRILPVPGEGLDGERRGRGDGAALRPHGPGPPTSSPRDTSSWTAKAVGKSERVVPGAILDVTILVQADPLAVVPEVVEGIKIIHDDDAIVVIDKPVGVAVHLAGVRPHGRRGTWPARASGSRPAARPERQGSSSARRRHVRRDGHLQPSTLTRAEERLSGTARSTRSTTRWSRATRSARGHDRRPDRPAPRADHKFAVMADGRHSVTHYETLEAHRFASLLEIHPRPDALHQIRVHGRAQALRAWAT